MDEVETASETTVRGGQICLDGSFIRPSHRQPDMVSGVRPMIRTLSCETTSPLYWKHLIHRTSFSYLPKSIWHPSRYPLMHSDWLFAGGENSSFGEFNPLLHKCLFSVGFKKTSSCSTLEAFLFFRPGHGSLFHSSLSAFLKFFANPSLDPPLLLLFLFCVNQELISIWLVASDDLKGATGNSTLLSCISGK